jgi:transcriptional regulator with XRE-family HTH domain
MPLDEREKRKKIKFLEELGDRIRQVRREKKMTASDLAKRVDMEKQNFFRIEKGQTSVTVYNLKRICSELNISMDDFFKDFKHK